MHVDARSRPAGRRRGWRSCSRRRGRPAPPASCTQLGDLADLRARTAPSVFGLVIMNTAASSSSFALQVVQVDEPVGVALDGDGLEARPASPWPGWCRGRCRGRAPSCARLAPVAEVARGDTSSAGQLALRPGRRLQRDGRQPGDLREVLLQLVEQLAARPAALPSSWQRMQVGEARQRREPLVPLRVVLHRARAERIEVGVDRSCASRAVEVAHDLQLGDLRQRRRLASRRRRSGSRPSRSRHVARGRDERAPAGLETSRRSCARRSRCWAVSDADRAPLSGAPLDARRLRRVTALAHGLTRPAACARARRSPPWSASR